MTCDECPLRERCYERRGICRDYIRYMERVERIRKQIEKLNETEKTLAKGAISTDEGVVSEASSRRRQIHQSYRSAVSLRPTTCSDPEAKTEKEKEARPQKSADSPRSPRLLDGVQGQEAHRDV